MKGLQKESILQKKATQQKESIQQKNATQQKESIQQKDSILQIENLTVGVRTRQREFQPIQKLSLCIPRGEIVAIVGESGCGKTMLCNSIMKLLPQQASFLEGRIVLDGQEIISLSEKEMHKIRGKEIAMVLQNPQSSLNPTLTIEKQLREVLSSEKGEKLLELLTMVDIDHPGERLSQYPYQLSGGMLQRIALAMALAKKPQLLLADEITTALDVTIQTEILDLLKDLQKKENLSVLFVSHDLAVVARVADKIAVMKDGRIVETGMALEVLQHPRHPYTRFLMGNQEEMMQKMAIPAHSQGHSL